MSLWYSDCMKSVAKQIINGIIIAFFPIFLVMGCATLAINNLYFPDEQLGPIIAFVSISLLYVAFFLYRRKNRKAKV